MATRESSVIVDKITELWEELRTVLTGRGNLLDAILPPLLFVLLNAVGGLAVGLWGALAAALGLSLLRLLQRQDLRYALGGLVGVAAAAGLAWLLGRAEGYFLPGLLNGALTVLLCLASLLLRRPLVAWTSFVARRWPLEWYWHPRVRPAYGEVTAAWTVYFALRLGLQLWLLQHASTTILGALQIALGWPATIVLLVLSYLYGTWRLRQLGGPSVAEFKAGAEPPWQGQTRGF